MAASPARTVPARPSPSRRARPQRSGGGQAPARRTRRPARASAVRASPSGVALLPAAVGRTAGAVGGLAESSLIVRLTRSRLWIGVLATLLGGIVALNVLSLSLGASIAGTAQKADGLERENSLLRAKVAERLGSAQVREAAADLGFAVAGTDSLRYVRFGPNDTERAAARLEAGELDGSNPLPEAVALSEGGVVEPAAPTEAPEAPIAPVPEEAAPPVGEVAPPAESTAPAPAPAFPSPAEETGPAGGGGGISP